MVRPQEDPCSVQHMCLRVTLTTCRSRFMPPCLKSTTSSSYKGSRFTEPSQFRINNQRSPTVIRSDPSSILLRSQACCAPPDNSKCHLQHVCAKPARHRRQSALILRARLMHHVDDALASASFAKLLHRSLVHIQPLAMPSLKRQARGHVPFRLLTNDRETVRNWYRSVLWNTEWLLLPLERPRIASFRRPRISALKLPSFACAIWLLSQRIVMLTSCFIP